LRILNQGVNDFVAWMILFQLYDYGERYWGEPEPYKYVRTTVTHSRDGVQGSKVKVCVQADGFSFRGKGSTLDEACQKVVEAIEAHKVWLVDERARREAKEAS